MCGIVGVYEFGCGEGSVTAERVIRMRDTLRHRGPDAEGVYVAPDRRIGVGHRRLAIVDPPGGAQPMFGAGGECLVFNGEIYNYPALRRGLEADGVGFSTACDTEVILHLYRRHGDRCLEHLDGMFAFALWDPRRGCLLFGRDRVGEKPFYWTTVGGRFVFGSEIKAVLAHPGVERGVNESALPAYLANLVVSSPETLYRGIYKLPPGTAGICDRAGVRTWRYWDLFSPRERPTSAIETSARCVRELLARSVHDRLMSDVPVGVLLSGGLDSSALVGLLHEQGRALDTFSVGFHDHPALDERAEARRVARHFGTVHHEVTISEADALGFLPDLVYHQDEPLADPVCIPLHFVCGLARRNGVKVVLAGEGSDELFWGYPRYRQIMARARWIRSILSLPAPARGLLPRLVPPELHLMLRELLEGLATGRPSPMHVPLGLTRHQRELVLGKRLSSNVVGWTPSNGRNHRDAVERLGFDTQEFEFAVRLPELLLMRIDRFSMAHGLEARVPFLDAALVEYAYWLPFQQKLDGGSGKLVLKQAVADLVPDWVIARRKQGFGAPVADWFHSRLGALLERSLADDGLRGHFDVKALRRRLPGGENPTAGGGGLWPVLNFALWHKRWIEDEPVEDLIELAATPAEG